MKTFRVLTVDLMAAIARDYEAGRTVKTITRKHDVGVRTVYAALEYAGCTRRCDKDQGDTVGARPTTLSAKEYGYDIRSAEMIDSLYAGRRYQDVRTKPATGRIGPPPVQHIPTYAATAWASL